MKVLNHPNCVKMKYFFFTEEHVLYDFFFLIFLLE
jgi:hypothetical protein